MTRGEYRVGVAFNPSGNDLVARIKRAAADLIDLIDSIPEPLDDIGAEEAHWQQVLEVRRCKALAQTETESAAHWAVKAATKPPVLGAQSTGEK